MPNSPRNTLNMLGHYAVCQVSYVLERNPWMVSQGFIDQITVLHDAHHVHVAAQDPKNDEIIEALDRLVLAMWRAEFGGNFPMQNRRDRPVTGGEGDEGIWTQSDPRRINPPVMQALI